MLVGFCWLMLSQFFCFFPFVSSALGDCLCCGVFAVNFCVCWVDVVFVQVTCVCVQKVAQVAFGELGFSVFVQELWGIAENCAELCKIATVCVVASESLFF